MLTQVLIYVRMYVCADICKLHKYICAFVYECVSDYLDIWAKFRFSHVQLNIGYQSITVFIYLPAD